MRVLIVGKNAKDIEQLVRNLELNVVTENPDVVISYGGDGTLLHSEREYPSVPKLPIRDSKVCQKCSDHETGILLKHLLENTLQLKEYQKLHTYFSGKDLYALNDFVVRNDHPVRAIRFQVTNAMSHPERVLSENEGRVEGSILIGDGIVVATPFGSTGYFKSITKQTFEHGFGLAFNNTTEEVPPIFFNKQDTVDFKLLRGTAHLTFDNSSDISPVKEGSTITFQLSDQMAKIYQPDSLRCPNCQVIRG